MDKAWLIYNCIEGYPMDTLTMISLDETDALETYMSLVEEELEETFFWMCQDSLEAIDQDWEERAQWLRLWDTLLVVMEVPVIHGDTCC